MRGLWRTSLSLSLGLLVSRAYAGDVEWRPVAPRPAVAVQATESVSVAGPSVSLDRPVPMTAPAAAVPPANPASSAAALGRPVPLTTPAAPQLLPPAVLDSQVQPVSFVGFRGDPSRITARGRAEELAKPLPLGPTAEGDPEYIAPTPKEVKKPEAIKAPASKVIATTPVPPECCTDCAPGPVPADCGTDCCATDCSPVLCEEGMHCCGLCGDGCLPESQFYVRGEALLWFTKGDKVPPLVTTGSVIDPMIPGAIGSMSTRVLFGGNEIGDQARGGARLTIGYWFGDEQWLGIEGSAFFLGTRGESFTASSNGTTILGRPFFDVTPTGLPGNANVLYQGAPAALGLSAGALAGSDTVKFSSRLWGAEANLRSNLWTGCCYHVGVLAGFRYLGLDDSLSIDETEIPFHNGTEPTFDFAALNDTFSTRNRFYGGQLGLDSEYRWRNWVFNLRSTVALGTTRELVNIHGSSTLIAGGMVFNSPNNGLLAQPTNSSRFAHSSFGVVPDLGLKVGYQFTDHLRAYIGYDLLYWSRVARPGAQIDTTVNSAQLAQANFPTQPPVPPPGPLFRPAFMNVHETSFWASGVSLGLEFNF